MPNTLSQMDILHAPQKSNVHNKYTTNTQLTHTHTQRKRTIIPFRKMSILQNWLNVNNNFSRMTITRILSNENYKLKVGWLTKVKGTHCEQVTPFPQILFYKWTCPSHIQKCTNTYVTVTPKTTTITTIKFKNISKSNVKSRTK